MKILLAHNYYRSAAPSGEDSVFMMERDLLQRAGHEVVSYERHNDDIGQTLRQRASTAIAATWSTRSYRDVRELVTKHSPDIAHFHNTFPLISPSAYSACQDLGVPVVQTLHNYRLVCPGALLMRDGRPCELCVGGNLIPSLRHACYRQSTSTTAIVGAMLIFNRSKGSYSNQVNRYIALTEFARKRFVRGGLPVDRMSVRPNYLSEVPEVGTGDGGYAIYVGRLTAEKGVATLVQAWRSIDLPLKIVGDGDLREQLEIEARNSGARIEFLGYKSRHDVWRLMQHAAFAIIPSTCYEGFPITVLEAFATGTPLIVSALGALDEVVETPVHGLKFPPGDSQSLETAILKIMDAPEQLRTMRIANRALFEARYTPTHALQSLESIYRTTLHDHAERCITYRSKIGVSHVN